MFTQTFVFCTQIRSLSNQKKARDYNARKTVRRQLTLPVVLTHLRITLPSLVIPIQSSIVMTNQSPFPLQSATRIKAAIALPLSYTVTSRPECPVKWGFFICTWTKPVHYSRRQVQPNYGDQFMHQGINQRNSDGQGVWRLVVFKDG